MDNEPPIDDIDVGSAPDAGMPLPPGFGQPSIPVMRPGGRRPNALGSRWDAWLPLLNNRAILSVLGLIVVLLLIAIVLVSIGHGSTNASQRTIISVPTSGAERTAQARGDLPATMLETASVRNGPDATFQILGTIHRGDAVFATGRSSTDGWIQIRYPPGTNLRGWVNADLLQVTGDVKQLSIAEPGPTPSIQVPTQEPLPTLYIIATQEPATETPSSPDATATGTPGKKETPTAEPQETPTPVSTEVPGG